MRNLTSLAAGVFFLSLSAASCASRAPMLYERPNLSSSPHETVRDYLEAETPVSFRFVRSGLELPWVNGEYASVVLNGDTEAERMVEGADIGRVHWIGGGSEVFRVSDAASLSNIPLATVESICITNPSGGIRSHVIHVRTTGGRASPVCFR